MLTIIDQGIISHRPDIGAYMPVITPLPDGTFIASQHVGQELGSPITTSRSCARRTVGNGTNRGSIHTPEHDLNNWSYRAPKISTVPGGGMVMTSSRFEKKDRLFDPNTEDLARCELALHRSDDNGDTWSAPQIIPVPLSPERYTWNGAAASSSLPPTAGMYPLETWKPEGYVGPPDQKAAAVFSSDQGESWGEFTVVADDTSGKTLWWDQMCSVLPDGRIYTLIWTHLYGTSNDPGQPLDRLR